MKLDKSFKYFLYALALVVIGILLHMQVNNWNESRKAALQEYVIYNETFPESQTEIKEVINGIVRDAQTANLEGLTSLHLQSDKFTKFGPRRFERQDVNQTNESESAHFGSVENFKMEVKDLKIDVFGNMGIATYYPHVSSEKGGKQNAGSARQTLVFLKTSDGWKIVHEHGTMRPE